MNLLKAWKAKLGAGSFLPSKNLYRKCEYTAHTPIRHISLPLDLGVR